MDKNKIAVTLSVLQAATEQNNRNIDLDLAHGCDVDGLNVIFKLADLLAQFVNGDLLILHHAHHLQLLDAIPDRDQLAGSPDEALHLDGLDLSEHGLEMDINNDKN